MAYKKEETVEQRDHYGTKMRYFEDRGILDCNATFSFALLYSEDKNDVADVEAVAILMYKLFRSLRNVLLEIVPLMKMTKERLFAIAGTFCRASSDLYEQLDAQLAKELGPNSKQKNRKFHHGKLFMESKIQMKGVGAFPGLKISDHVSFSSTLSMKLLADPKKKEGLLKSRSAH